MLTNIFNKKLQAVFFFFNYLAVTGLSCSMQDLSLWCTGFSLVAAV